MLRFNLTMADSFEVTVSTPKQNFSNSFIVVLRVGNFKAEDDSFVFSEY